MAGWRVHDDFDPSTAPPSAQLRTCFDKLRRASGQVSQIDTKNKKAFVKICVIRGKTELSPRIARIDTKKTKKLVQIRAIRGKENVASRHELHELTRRKLRN